ncbi:unnamed protein product [Protopolystoma xenopodis]|uniref:Uncharacterized protein n=1 Tax=Protopolystoma xenopodis TaxID=117903 RepID=A0A448XLZ9_9PLAT|nr:unnamed protein product [Protopolystoma xenopodis]
MSFISTYSLLLVFALPYLNPDYLFSLILHIFLPAAGALDVEPMDTAADWSADELLDVVETREEAKLSTGLTVPPMLESLASIHDETAMSADKSVLKPNSLGLFELNANSTRGTSDWRPTTGPRAKASASTTATTATETTTAANKEPGQEGTPFGCSGNLHGDVYNWADLIQNYIQQLAQDGIRRDVTQRLFDRAAYKAEKKHGHRLVQLVSNRLGEYIADRKKAAYSIVQAAVRHYDEMIAFSDLDQKLSDPSIQDSLDSDRPNPLLSSMLQFNPYFKQRVTINHSTFKVPDEVPRNLSTTIHAINWTYALEQTMRGNFETYPSLK